MCVLSLSVWNQSQKSSWTVSFPKGSAQTWPAPPASIYRPEAQTRWSGFYRDEASARDSRAPRSCPTPPFRNLFHEKNPPPPPGGGWTCLWGEEYLCFFCLFSSLSLLYTAACSDPQKVPPSGSWLYITHWLHVWVCVQFSKMWSSSVLRNLTSKVQTDIWTWPNSNPIVQLANLVWLSLLLQFNFIKSFFCASHMDVMSFWHLSFTTLLWYIKLWNKLSVWNQFKFLAFGQIYTLVYSLWLNYCLNSSTCGK